MTIQDEMARLQERLQRDLGAEVQVVEVEPPAQAHPMNKIRRAIHEATQEGEGTADPCLNMLVGGHIDVMSLDLVDHVEHHFSSALEAADNAADIRGKLKLRAAFERYEAQSTLEGAPEDLLKADAQRNKDVTDAFELVVLHALLKMLVAKGSIHPPIAAIAAARSYYDAAEQLARALFAQHFPTLSWPSDSAETAGVPVAPAPTPAPQETATETVEVATGDTAEAVDFGYKKD
jgi:hypothetical protein